MMRVDWRQGLGVLVGLGLAVAWQSIPDAVGQTTGQLPSPPGAASRFSAAKVSVEEIGDGVPTLELSPLDKAMLAERGKQLVEKLSELRRIESSLGRKHPSMAEIQLEIDEIELQLKSWAIDPNNASASPVKSETLSNADLRRLVLQMAVKIDRLETRIGVLERRSRRP